MGQTFIDGLTDRKVRKTMRETHNRTYWDFANKATCIAAAKMFQAEERALVHQLMDSEAIAGLTGLDVVWIPREWFQTDQPSADACHFCKLKTHLSIDCRIESNFLLQKDWARQPEEEDHFGDNQPPPPYTGKTEHQLYIKRIHYTVIDQQLRTLKPWRLWEDDEY
jgi:hypothetical protein